jgi:hypothetical protein
MLTADQIAEFRREHEWRFPYGYDAKMFAEICSQAAMLSESCDRWRALAERLGEALVAIRDGAIEVVYQDDGGNRSAEQTCSCGAYERADAALADLRAMEP